MKKTSSYNRPRQHDHRISQADRALQVLQEAGSGWISAVTLSRISLQYCRAIRSLRKRGYVIENRVEWHQGRKFGFYRLVGRCGLGIFTKQNPPPQPDTGGTLFPDQSDRSPHRDDN